MIAIPITTTTNYLLTGSTIRSTTSRHNPPLQLAAAKVAALFVPPLEVVAVLKLLLNLSVASHMQSTELFPWYLKDSTAARFMAPTARVVEHQLREAAHKT